VVKVGRIAGQFAKPRSSDTETKGDVTLPSYRGDIINDYRLHEPRRAFPIPSACCMAYRQSAATLNLLRAFASGGYADLSASTKWTLGFMKGAELVPSATRLAKIDRTPSTSCAPGAQPRQHPVAAHDRSSPATRRCCSATSRR
jgi:3-deoxy-7-phosphoheptulonate synthase